MLACGSKDHILCLINHLEYLVQDINDVEECEKLKRQMEDWDWQKETYIVQPCPIILFILMQSGSTENVCKSCGLRTPKGGWMASCIWSQRGIIAGKNVWWNDSRAADRLQGVLQTIAMLKSYM